MASDNMWMVEEKKKVRRTLGFLAGSLVWEDGVPLAERRIQA